MELRQQLQTYQPFDACETEMVERLKKYLQSTFEGAFGRELAGAPETCGHVTGSAWIVNRAASRVVLVHHAKLNKWVQPGGHCDGESDVLSVALREAQEETGLAVQPWHEAIFDVDVHRIPAYWYTPAHFHYDVRFLLSADDTAAPLCSPESRAVRWVTLDEAARLNESSSIARMIAKTQRLQTR